MNKLLNSKYGILIFSLFGGLGYFLLILTLISETKYSYLLGFFFFPTIVCGVALCIFKTIKQWQQEEQYQKIYRLIYIHIALFVFSVIFAAAVFLNRI
ncbi:MAG: hypothetical protein SOZ34_11030 [Clostridia bacterium]|nr:hypothetical protein [Clostridia bacterium]